MQQTTEELQLRIRELEKEITRLHKAVKEQRYGLHWLDVPEAFETESENKIPILEEVKDKNIVNDDGKPTHILIEGDNYHALTCLNYTHKGKIDVIYIDPPYNTGSTGKDSFIYKDKRVLNEYPDGTSVPKDHPLRHSYWLSFMNKRLELAKDLLSDTGVILISIDDNEVAQLKLLCNKIFDENNFVGQWNWFKSATPPNLSHKIKKNIEYILGYEKKKNNSVYQGLKKDSKSDDPITKPQNSIKTLIFPPNSINLKIRDGVIRKGIYGTEKFPNTLLNDLIVENNRNINEVSFENKFIWLQEKLNAELKNNTIINCSKSLVLSYKKQNYSPEVPPNLINENVGVSTTEEAGKELTLLFGDKVFDFPKPVSLIEYLLKFKQSSTVLDFFAGSGTTLHATMKLNEEDGGNRQCLLVQMNENGICQNVTYERNRMIMQGYTNSKGEKVEGLGNSLKYYRTSFVGKNNPTHANDTDKVELSHKAGYLLALSENTLNETITGKYYQVFENEHSATAIYFHEDLSEIEQFVASVAKNGKQTAVYIFSWSNGEEFLPMFDHLSHVAIKTIPQPILEIYRSINK
ncbi:MAG: site-specific DNA-methyltransferase [Paludibacter sp.]